MKLKELKQGTVFSFCGHECVVLKHKKNGYTLVLAKDCVTKMPFSNDSDNKYTNSPIRAWLNDEFLKQIKLPVSEMKPMKNGDYIFLLSLKQYRKCYKHIPVSSWWWLRSPGYFSNLAATVYYDGQLTIGSDYNVSVSGGVRPAFNLKSDFEISNENEE